MVRLSLHESGKVLAVLTARLVPDLFDEYNEVCLIHGIKRRGGVTVMPIGKALTLSRALRHVGLKVEVDADVKRAFYKTSGITDDDLTRIQNSPLFHYQKEDAIWMASRKKALLASEMGTGKTALTLMALTTNPAVVIVCPSSIKAVWKNEIATWRPSLEVFICEGRGTFRWPKRNEAVIINYEILPKENEIDVPDNFTGTLIADECHYIKNPKSQRTKRFRKLAKEMLKTGKCWLLSGTPLMNQPFELWHVLYSAKLENMVFKLDTDVYSAYKNFLRLFKARPATFGGFTFGTPDASVPRRLGRAAIRRTRKEVMPELPGKLYTTNIVSLDKKSQKVCDRFIEAAEEAGVDLDAAITEASMGKESRTLFEEMSEARRILATAKIPAMMSLAETFEEAGEPVVVFSAHLDPIKMLGEREGWRTITGSDKADDREESVRLFQAGELKGLACTIKAGGVGITLTRAHQVVFVDMDWTPANNLQAEDRLCRIGQTKGVVVTRLIANHNLDKRLTWILTQKKKLIEAVYQ